MEVTFINIGFGESILIEHQNYRILVDAGFDRLTDYQDGHHQTAAQYLKANQIKWLDLVVMTHIHDDHCSDMVEVLRTCEVGRIWVNCLIKTVVLPFCVSTLGLSSIGGAGGFLESLNAYFSVLEIAEHCGIPVEEIKTAGFAAVELGTGLKMGLLPADQTIIKNFMQLIEKMAKSSRSDEFLSFASQADKLSNQTSLGLHIQSPDLSVLLTADKSSGWEQVIADFGQTVQADILKAAHHGVANRADEQLLFERVRPSVFVVCTSSDRRYQTPSDRVIEQAEVYFRKSGQPVRISFSDSVDWPPYSLPARTFSALMIRRDENNNLICLERL